MTLFRTQSAIAERKNWAKLVRLRRRRYRVGYAATTFRPVVRRDSAFDASWSFFDSGVGAAELKRQIPSRAVVAGSENDLLLRMAKPSAFKSHLQKGKLK